MKRSLTRQMLVAAALVGVVIVAMFAFMLAALVDLDESNKAAARAAQVTASANRLQRLVIDLQTGTRGYVITEDEAFLAPWQQARRELPAEERALLGLIADPGQQTRARALVAAVDDYLEEYANPLVETTRVDPERGRDVVRSGRGKLIVDDIRAGFDEFVAAEATLARQRDERARSDARTAFAAALAGIVVAALLILLYAAWLARRVARPLRRIAAAAKRLAGGERSAQVDERAPGELGVLAGAFNEMARVVAEREDELEAQNAELEQQTLELEQQTLELEDNQAGLAAANDELSVQQAELEQALAELGAEKELVEASHRFAEQVAEETNVRALAALTLEHAAAAAAAEIGLAQVRSEEGAFEVATTRGVAPESITPVVAGAGLAGRALAEKRIVTGDHGESGFAVDTFGGRAPVRRELHVPLVHAERCLGVLSLGRLADREFSAAELGAVQHLADQATIGLANALALRDVRRLADVNRAVLDATTDAIAMIDLDGRLVVTNAAMEQTGASAALLGNESIWEMTGELAQRATDPEAYLAALKRLQDDPKREAVDVYQLAASGGWLQRYSAPVRDSEGGVVGRIFVLRDISAEREAQQLKSDLVATVSHELRTPLTGILGFAELLATNEVDEESRQSYVETIQREAQRLRDLINDFLDLQRIEEGEFRLTLEPVRLDELVREQATVLDTHELHELELDVEPGLMVLGERDRITQVVANLVSNAVKYSPSGGTVRVSARGSGPSVRVEVTDSGIGIPEAQQRRIFEKFFRVDSSDTRRIGGTGLGLALSRDIIEAHGGTIGFSSSEGLGSTFWFELPRVERDSVDPVRPARARVLVVEDHAGTTELLQAQLEEDGYDVEVAPSGEEALARVAQNRPAVICLDIGLSGQLDGWEVLTRLKSSAATAGIPVIVCTGSEREERAAVFGAADFLTKPVSRERLLEAVARLVPSGRGSVLVVDDEATVRRLVTTTLAGHGLTVREAADGAEALVRIAEERPDVIVLDLTMPVLDGFAVLERLLDDPETRSIPVIVLTARVVTADERKRLHERAITVLEKSAYSAHELRRLVQQAAA